VRLKSIAVFSEPGSDLNPAKMKAYSLLSRKLNINLITSFINREDLDFDTVDSTKADQEWELIRIEDKEVPEYPCKLTKFTNVRHLTLYFPENFGADVTRITYVGLKGEWRQASL
jgi:hypothetical protein